MDKQLVFQTDDRPEELLRTLEQLERDLDRCVELSRPTLGGERYLTRVVGAVEDQPPYVAGASLLA